MTLSSLLFSEYRAATYVLALVVGWLVALALTPVVRSAAIKLGFVDKPGGRKIQKNAIALGGGIAVFGGAITAIIVALLFADSALTVTFFEGDARFGTGLAVASLATLVLGLYDDATNMRGRYKLLGQAAIAGVLVYQGLYIENLSLFGMEHQLGWMAYPFAMFWLLGSTNAINLLDGIDGLASGIGMVLCLTLAALSAYAGSFIEATIALALTGALLGFLRYNFAPATIYLGDAGSMVIGLVIGAVALKTQFKEQAAIGMVVPMAVWAVPILDSFAAILRRRLTGRSIFAPDRGHLHHSLLTRGWSVPQATIFITLVCAITCLGAVLGVVMKSDWVVFVTVAGVVVWLVSSRTFGHIEFELLRHRFKEHGFRLGRTKSPAGGRHQDFVRLQGSHEWEVLWDSLVEAAPEYGLTKLRLTIHMPAVHEAFYATWKVPKGAAPQADEAWTLTHPLKINGEPIGKLDLAGIASDAERPTLSQITQVLDFFEPIEEHIANVKAALAAGKNPSAGPARTALTSSKSNLVTT